MSKSKFKVYGRFDGTSEATVIIDRGPCTIEVRPYRRHKSYILPLSVVADIVMSRCMKANAEAIIRARKEKRKGL
jgi:hypothetical protein